MASLICHLPDEILANILSHVSASDMVVSLYLCGDRTLNARLCRGGCTSFVAVIDELLKWPRVLSQLKSLRKVFMQAEVVREPIQWMLAELPKLPRSLETLHLDFPRAADLLVPPPIEHDSKLGTATPSSSAPAQVNLLDLGTLFPSMRTLHALNRSYNGRISLSSSELALVPRGLTSLRLSGLVKSTSCYATLPRTLTHLEVDCNDLKLKNFEAIPSGLKECPSLNPLSIGDLSHLPSLTTLVYVSDKLSSADIAALPRGATQITLKSDILNIVLERSLWPSHLTSLKCQHMSATTIGNLPDTITHLSFEWLEGFPSRLPPGADPGSYWPKSLTQLVCQERYPLLNANMLPRTLTSLKNFGFNSGNANGSFLDQWCSDSTYDSYYIPPLKELDVICVNSANRDQAVLRLPSTLESLNLDWEGCPAEIIVPNLPTTCLTTLTLEMHILAAHIPLLPRQLTFLSIRNLSGSLAQNGLSHLPSSLRTLKMMNRNGFDARAFAHLPRSIKHLLLYSYHATLELFVYLPTTMDDVRVGRLENYSNEIAAQVPLRWLHFLLEDPLVRSVDLELIYSYWPDDVRLTPLQTYFLKRGLPSRKLRLAHQLQNLQL